MKNLIGMVDFVLLGWNDIAILRNYANFLKQPLALWMLVPCDDNGNVLEEECIDEKLCKYCPLEDYRKHNSVGDSCEGSRCDVAAENYRDEYQLAKERCLFEGFEYNDGYLINGMNCINTKLHQTIEDLVKYNLELTPTAQL